MVGFFLMKAHHYRVTVPSGIGFRYVQRIGLLRAIDCGTVRDHRLAPEQGSRCQHASQEFQHEPWFLQRELPGHRSAPRHHKFRRRNVSSDHTITGTTPYTRAVTASWYRDLTNRARIELAIAVEWYQDESDNAAY